MQSSIKISFLGDISLNNGYESIAKKSINPFNEVSEILLKSDAVIGNLECLAYGNGVNIEKFPRIGTSIQTFSLLKQLNIKVVTLAHNHFYDNLDDGFLNTTSYLSANNILYLGAGEDKSEAEAPLFLTIGNISVCFLNYVSKDTNPKVPNDAKIFANIYDTSRIINEIQKYKKSCDHLILLFHWGGKSEGYSQPDWYQTRDAKQFIDAGADLIIGGHSHVLQPYEVYCGKYIFYSLGNFCFDDVICDGQVFKWDKKSKQSIIANISFHKKAYDINIVPIVNNQNNIVINYSVLKILKQRNKIFKLIFSSYFLWKAYNFNEQYVYKAIDFIFSKDKSLAFKFKRVLSKISKF